MPSIQNPPKIKAMGNLDIQNLKVSFHTREGIIHAVDGVDLSIKPGEIIGLVGESGSGKSVTCNSILQLLPTPPAHIEGEQSTGQEKISSGNTMKRCGEFGEKKFP